VQTALFCFLGGPGVHGQACRERASGTRTQTIGNKVDAGTGTAIVAQQQKNVAPTPNCHRRACNKALHDGMILRLAFAVFQRCAAQLCRAPGAGGASFTKDKY
jgi:hypothetical protein